MARYHIEECNIMNLYAENMILGNKGSIHFQIFTTTKRIPNHTTTNKQKAVDEVKENILATLLHN